MAAAVVASHCNHVRLKQIAKRLIKHYINMRPVDEECCIMVFHYCWRVQCSLPAIDGDAAANVNYVCTLEYTFEGISASLWSQPSFSH